MSFTNPRRGATIDPMTATKTDAGDLADVLPVGFRDPQSPNFIPEELRQAVADFPPDRLTKIRRKLYANHSAVIRGRHVIDPSESEEALTTVALWLTMEDIRQRQRSAKQQEESRAYDARRYTCPACAVVSVATITGAGTRPRRLPDGTTAVLCERCHPIADRLTLDRLTAERVNGSTRGLVVAHHLDGAQR